MCLLNETLQPYYAEHELLELFLDLHDGSILDQNNFISRS